MVKGSAVKARLNQSTVSNLKNIDLLLTLDFDFPGAVAILEHWLNEYQARQRRAKPRL